MAEEVVMDVFAKAMSRWTLFSRAEHPNAYLRQMVVNLCRSRGRRKSLEKRWVERLKHEAKESFESGPEVHGIDAHVWAAVRQLPQRQRTCVVLRYLDDLSEPEIAAVLDIPVGTVKSQLSRARKKLAGLLGAEIAEDEG
jgi:RNA polymerase sigma-70 factor (ECF subfamily)